jgi:putative redox protein
MTSQIIYTGALRTEATHLQSGSTIQTDAPTDNQGKGERFSPTDLLATALGACMVTTMGIKAQTMPLALDGTRVEVTKVMVADPRRVGKIIVTLHLPASIGASEEQKIILERVARACPVERSLHPDLVLELSFNWAS